VGWVKSLGFALGYSDGVGNAIYCHLRGAILEDE